MQRLSQEARAVLLTGTGSARVAFRFEVIRDGAKLREISAEGSVSLNNADSIGRTARLTLREPLDWLREEIKPYLRVYVGRETRELEQKTPRTVGEIKAMRLTAGEIKTMGPTLGRIKYSSVVKLGEETADRYEEFPLGLFIPSTPKKSADENGAVTWEASCYDHTVILREDCIPAPLFIPAGTKYLDAVRNILAGVGADGLLLDETDTAIPTDREFETGTQKLEIINKLLSEINYNRLRCDGNGNFLLSAYRIPRPENVTAAYSADGLSVILRELDCETDYYSAPNVFVVTVSNPELDTPYRAEYVNDDPVSPLSTVSRGRRIYKSVEPPDVVASQEDLEAYLARAVFELSRTPEVITFYTALMPHEAGEIVALSHPDAAGVYEETGFTMELTAGGRMTHTARRISGE